MKLRDIPHMIVAPFSVTALVILAFFMWCIAMVMQVLKKITNSKDGNE